MVIAPTTIKAVDTLTLPLKTACRPISDNIQRRTMAAFGISDYRCHQVRNPIENG